MNRTDTPPAAAPPAFDAELDGFVAAFERAAARDPAAAPAAFLPPADHPKYRAVLRELARIDLEFAWDRDAPRHVEAYRDRLPDLFADPDGLRAVAWEEYRLRRAAGECPTPAEYRRRLGIDLAADAAADDLPRTSVLGAETADGPTTMPGPGDRVGEFEVVRELGRGAFGRVFLAHEPGLAGRPVVLKVSSRLPGEAQTLARLQHTNIVPIYTVRRHGPYHVLVMPFLGATTLADLLASFRGPGGLPGSGKGLVSTLAGHAQRTAGAASDGSPAPPTGDAPGLSREALARLEAKSYPDAVLWFGAQLADALAHAHARGVLHRDVKPANVLLTDDGRPMLLDFNLAADADSPADVGGTPAYMAPEQRAALGGGRTRPDARSDVYSLGLVLAELLTGTVYQPDPDAPPDIRARNPQVTPSAQAILRKCLAFDPAARYVSARELADELDRQLAYRPLQATREPSPRERLRKWRRRHPLLASNGAVAAAAVVCVLALAAGLVARQRHVRSLIEDRDTADKLAAFRQDAVPVYERLVLRDVGADTAEADRLLARYAVAEDDAWAGAGPVARLPEAGRRDLAELVAELLLLKARLAPDPAAAIRDNERAAAALEPWRPVPRSVWQDRAAFARALGREADAQAWEGRARAAPPEGRDFYLAGLAARQAGRYGEAAGLFEQAVAADPRHYWSWLLLGDVRTLLGRDDLAEGCFDACVALQPTYLRAYHNRALCRHRLRRYDDALADFTRALDLEPANDRARVARGVTFQALGRWPEAEADLTRAIDAGAAETRAFFLRAEVRAAAGDAAGAARDRDEGMRRTPADEASWVTRALARAAAGDAAGALADLDRALALNPRSYAALMNKANVLDERLHRVADAVVALDRLVETYPHTLPPRSGRAVLLARLGRRAAARADAAYCLAHDPDPFVRYQLAGAYALLSQDRPADAVTALDLLRSALKDGTGHDFLPGDPDLAPLHGRRDFLELAEAARVLTPSTRR